MIIVKLSEILGQKKLKISDVMAKTGITRPTLTSLYYDKAKGINFDTLDKLCKFLSVSVNDLLLFYDIDIKSITIDFHSLEQGIADNSDNHGIIESGDFKGIIRFEQKHLDDLIFSGHISFDSFNPEKYDSFYEMDLAFNIKGSEFRNTYPDDISDILITTISNKIKQELSEYDDCAVINTVFTKSIMK